MAWWRRKTEEPEAQGLALHHIAMRLFNTPLMIEPGKLQVIEHALGSRFGIMVPNNAAVEFQPRQRKPYRVTVDGTAVINVFGSLVQRAGGAEADSGLTSYQQLSREFDQALEDPEVTSILLLVDSPGGEAAGVWDLVDQIAQGAKKKKTMSLADGMAASAAYAIASAATTMYATQGSTVGSIGVIASHVDQSQYDAALGVKVTHVFAGAHKADFSPHQPLEEGAVGEIRKLVDDSYQLFVAKVAAARGLSHEAVRATEARLFTTTEAQSLGLIDGVSTFEQLLAGTDQREEVPMADRMTLAQLQQDYPDMLQLHTNPLVAAAAENARTEERARIQEIFSLAGVQVPGLLQSLLFTDPVDPGTAAKQLLTTKEKVKGLAAAAFLSDGIGPAEVIPGQDPGSADSEFARAKSLGQFVNTMRAQSAQ